METIMEQAAAMLPAPVEEALQKAWLEALELQVWQEVFCPCEDAPPKPSGDDTLLIQPPYTDIYVYHILRQEALLHGDIEQYNQYQLLFASRYREFAAWYLRNHRPIRN